MIEIKQINTAFCSITPINKEILDNLGYYYDIWIQGRYGKQKKRVFKRLLRTHPSRKGLGEFCMGFLPRVESILTAKEMSYRIDLYEEPISVMEPELEGITFRPDQLRALSDILRKRRGVFKAPTGSGKTIVIAGLISALVPGKRALIIVHTKKLFTQTVEEMQRFFPKVGEISSKLFVEQDVTVAMRQSLARRIQKGVVHPEFFGSYEMVVVDEAHHVSSFKGEYAKILESIYAPFVYGVTATPPNGQGEGSFALEGLIGHKIATTEYTTLEKEGVLAKPKVKILKTKESDSLRGMKGGYAKIYEKGIVMNRSRNILIINTAFKLLEQGRTVLIMVERIEHGEQLMKYAKLKKSGVFVFLNGEVDEDVLDEEKIKFEAQARKGVIATRVWSEGINIKSIGAVINAVGDESAFATIQRFGRGMRKTEGKEEVILVDFVDLNHTWFVKHSLKRIMNYIEVGWLK